MTAVAPDAATLRFLQQLSPFDSMGRTYLRQLGDHVAVQEVEKGTLLFKRGKSLPSLYYLLNGSVELVNAQFNSETVEAGDERSRRALNDVTPTAVSARALEPLRVLLVDAAFLDLAMAWSESASGDKTAVGNPETGDELDGFNLEDAHVEVSEEFHDWMSGLLASPLFQKIPPANISQAISRFEAIDVTPGQSIVREGEAGDFFYVIDKGRALVRNIAGTLQLTLKPGQFFGEEALVAESPRNATVTMLTEGTLMRLSKADFSELMHEPVQKRITARELGTLGAELQIIDVRMPFEYRTCHVPKSVNIPLSAVRRKLADLPASGRYVITDDGGCRSRLAAWLFCQAGLETSLLVGAERLYPGQA